MKGIFVMLMAIMIGFGSISVFADENLVTNNTENIEIVEEEEVVTENDPQDENFLKIEISMLPCMKVIDSVAVFELYSKNGIKLGNAEEWIGGITENFTLKFEIPSTDAGDKYILKLKSGLTYIRYNDKSYGTDEGVELTLGEEAMVFSISAFPIYEHAIVPYVEGRQIKSQPDARLINGIAMVPVRAVSEELGLLVRYDGVYNSVVCSFGEREIIFNVGTAYATIFGEDKYLPANCEMIEDTVFVPVRALAEALGCTVEALEFGDHIDVCISSSPMVMEYIKTYPVNEWGLSSRTEYLVWVDKSDYMVRVYKGKEGLWNQIKEYPCAIGAPNSPTITGSYEYQYRMKQWDYFSDGFYVAPCLVFYGNYALHSTLLSYSGGVFDDRVGVMISHGCVRLHKEDIDWLSDNLPIGSRIYITE